MAKVQMEKIVEHLSYQMRKALAQTFENAAPGVEIDEYEFFREFRRSVARKCSTWEVVPDEFVESD
jgi:hypothetical protein